VPIQYAVEHFATAVAATSGSLAARGKQVDLFGVVVLAQVTALGGGTLRDVILDARPVFWVADPGYVITATLAALFIFVVARFLTMPRKFLLLADAGGLALFTALGVNKALATGVSPVVAVAMGVMTGVAGGIIRDVLTQEIPLVFRHHINLYATASLCGATVFALLQSRVDPGTVWSLAIATTLVLRLAAIQWEIRLPLFHAR
jgi:uncharacterized membrane protein YeiH